MTAPTVSMVMIARDEAKQVEQCFSSFWEHVDEVVLVDTGSKDKTVEVAKAFAAERGEPEKLVVGEYAWHDDFAAARAYADSLASGTWLTWCDLDDVIRGAEQLRRLAGEASPDLAGYVAEYNYAQDRHGNCLCRLRRERLVRAGASRWEGAIHEAQAVNGRLMMVPPDVIEWVHAEPPDPASTRRNLRILRKWCEREPSNPRVRAYLGTEELVRGKPKRALAHFRRYLKLPVGWDEERAQVHRKLAIALGALGRHREAIEVALKAIDHLPSWPDSYLTLAQSYHELGESAKAEEWAREVIRRGPPDTMLILNPLDYTLAPRLVLASALGAAGRLDEAVEVAEEALTIVPNHPGLLRSYAEWRSARQREATAQTFVAAAQQLVAHDEQLKALKLLEETVPYYARDHWAVVAARSELRERLADLLDPEAYAGYYRRQGSTPADMIPDERVDEVAGGLSRCRFLLEGITEQMAEA